MDLKKTYSIWNDSWKLYRKYAERGHMKEEDWCDAIFDANRFAEDHGRGMATKMAVLILDMLQSEQKSHGDKITA